MGDRRHLTAAEKKMRGTFNQTRDREQEQAEITIASNASAMFTPDNLPKCPDSITTPYCKKYWKDFTRALTSFGVLSYVDIPQVEALVVTLEKMRAAEEALVNADILDPDFDNIMNRFMRLSDKFDKLSAAYFVSPAARSKLRLEDLNIQKTQAELDRQSPLMQILAGRS